MKKTFLLISFLATVCFAEKPLFSKEQDLAQEITSNKEPNFVEETAPTKQQILYLAQAQDCKEALIVYKKYREKLGRHDFEVRANCLDPSRAKSTKHPF
jgi:hypothetical protein